MHTQPTGDLGAAGLIRFQLYLVKVAKAVTRVIDRPLPRTRAPEDFDALIPAVFVDFLDPPGGVIDPVAEDIGAEIFGHDDSIGASTGRKKSRPVAPLG